MYFKVASVSTQATKEENSINNSTVEVYLNRILSEKLGVVEENRSSEARKVSFKVLMGVFVGEDVDVIYYIILFRIRRVGATDLFPKHDTGEDSLMSATLLTIDVP